MTRRRRPAAAPPDAAGTWLAAAALVLLTIAAYVPVLRAGYVWDDDVYVTANPFLRTAAGLWRIWTDPHALPQYYPLVFTSFWIERHLWGVWPGASHAINVLLHAASAVALWRLLARLRVPGAWLAAAIFALHPVHVESVAWITERKNVLSGLFYLLSFRIWLDLLDPESGPPPRGTYALGLASYFCALLSKTVTATLPAALLIVLWWRRGRVRAAEAARLAPAFVLGAGMGLLTAALEHHHLLLLEASRQWSLTALDRLVLAGQAVWFYAGKLIWPAHLSFIYPRWMIDARVGPQWCGILAAAAALAGLWSARTRLGRGPVAAVLLFLVTIFPALGFVDAYPFQYSFVADHFQYLASIPLIALAAAAAARAAAAMRAAPDVAAYPAVLLLAVLGLLTSRQARIYHDARTLWTDTVVKQPSSWMAHCNLGVIELQSGREARAEAEFLETVRLAPTYSKGHANLATVALRRGEYARASASFRRAIELDPAAAEAHDGLGSVLLIQGRPADAEAEFREAVRLEPGFDLAYADLGLALTKQGRDQEAADMLRRAVALDPSFGEAHYILATVLTKLGQAEEARREFEAAAANQVTEWHMPEADAASP